MPLQWCISQYDRRSIREWARPGAFKKKAPQQTVRVRRFPSLMNRDQELAELRRAHAEHLRELNDPGPTDILARMADVEGAHAGTRFVAIRGKPPEAEDELRTLPVPPSADR